MRGKVNVPFFTLRACCELGCGGSECVRLLMLTLGGERGAEV